MTTGTFSSFPFDNQLSFENEWMSMKQYDRNPGFIPIGVSGIGQTFPGYVPVGPCRPIAGSGLSVDIQTGRAYIRGFYFTHTGDPETITLDTNSSGSDRTDGIFLKLDRTNNIIGYEYKAGDVVPVQNSTVWELPLCQVTVPNLASTIVQSDIYDNRRLSYNSQIVPAAKRINTGSFSIPGDENYATGVTFNGVSYVTNTNMIPVEGAPGEFTRIFLNMTNEIGGYFLVTGRMTFGAGSSGRRGLGIFLNATPVSKMEVPATTDIVNINFSSIVQSTSSGDFISLRALNTASSSIPGTNISLEVVSVAQYNVLALPD